MKSFLPHAKPRQKIKLRDFYLNTEIAYKKTLIYHKSFRDNQLINGALFSTKVPALYILYSFVCFVLCVHCQLYNTEKCHDLSNLQVKFKIAKVICVLDPVFSGVPHTQRCVVVLSSLPIQNFQLFLPASP